VTGWELQPYNLSRAGILQHFFKIPTWQSCRGLQSESFGTKTRFTLGVSANVQPKSSIPIGAKVEISPEGFTLGVKAEIEKNLFIVPQVQINAELYL